MNPLASLLPLVLVICLLGIVQSACPAGSSCETDGTVIDVCEAGSFSIANQYTCQTCPIGTKCPSTEQTAPTPCDSGQYQPNTGQTSCITCPAGHMCPVTTIAPVACPSGWYAATGQTSCTNCNDGQYCPLYSQTPVTCPTGTYSKANYQQCEICPAGYTCDSNPAANPSICPVTEFKVKSGEGTCQACPAGMECLDRTTVPTICAFGEYSTATDGICSTCVANGKECPNIKTENTRTCEATTYYDWWSSPPHCKACEPGFLCHPTQFTRVTCPAGHYSDDGVCTICPAGQFCPQIYVPPINCPTGYYQPVQGAVSCMQIPPGYTSSDRVTLSACDSGTYFTGLGTCADCPVGFMCPDPKYRKIPCMPGEYQNQVKQTTCIVCPAGSHCTDTVSAPVAVSGNNFAPAGSINQIPCPVGYECSNSAILNPICQWGQYHDGTSCTNCPAGKFCTHIRGDAPRDCQEGTYSPVGYMECIPCPPGKECSVDGTTITTCDAGKYSFETEYSCTWGRPNYYTPLITSSISAPCPPGSYQDTDRNTCRPCPANQSCLLTNSAKLLSDYTPAGSTADACSGSTFSLAGDGFCRDNLPGMDGTNICALGTYSEGSSCVACQAGHYCPDPALMPIECPPGTYQDLTSQTTCKVCQPGKYCLYKATEQTDCPVGYFCMVSWQAPQPCPAGHYSDGNAQSCTICPNTKYCDGAAHGPLASLDDCPANMYCNTPFLGALPQYRLCPAGTLSTAGQAAYASDCSNCAAGTYCEFSLTRTEVTCPKGYYCPARTQYRTQYRCPQGTYNALTGKSLLTDCLDCPAGNYCRPASTVSTNKCPYGAQCSLKADNQAIEIWCPEGFYSNEADNQQTCTVCPAGHFCPKAATKAFPCPPGTHRATSGGTDLQSCTECTAGYACRLPAQTSPTSQDCANGHYCPPGTESPYQFPCPYGTWSNGVVRLTGITGCVACPAGYACPLGSHTTKDIYPCPQGHYCPAGTKFPYSSKCPAGTYNLLRQKTLLSDCVNCPAGYFCPAGSPSPTDLCPPGHYCPINTKYKYQYPCRAGTYNPKWGQIADTSCLPCPEKYFCPEGTDWPVHCPRGHYCTASRQFQEASQTSAGDPDFTTRNAGSIVTAGSYAARRSSAQTVCADGMYSHTGASRCETCANGFACEPNASGLENVIQNSKCPAGDWCFDGTGMTHASCTLGSYCLQGDFLPHQCKAGTFSDSVGKDSRETCSNTVEGYWTPPGSAYSSRYQCEPGHYCPQNSIQSDQTPCQAGTYRNTIGAREQSDCSPCPVGHYCPIGTSEPIPCGDGHYCDQTSLSLPKDCEPGTFSDIDNRSTTCEACPVGKACTHYGLPKPDFLCASGFLCTGGQSETSGDDIVCTAGGYCEIGTTIKESCKAGTYNPNEGKQYLLDCQKCPVGEYCAGSNASTTSGQCTAGYFCTGGATTPTQNVALPGYYTLAGASSQTKCDAGEYQDLFAQSQCKQCEAGFYCNTEANDGTERIVCPAGYYCVVNSQTPQKCPAGTYSFERGLKAESECLPCLPGYYCPLTGTYELAQMELCNAGYFCKESAVVGTPASDTPGDRFGPCTVGHYCPVGTAEPIPCPAGTYSNAQSLGAESDCTPCTAGKYCPYEGQTAATLDCDAGYFCPEGEKQARRSVNACPAGTYCPAGSAIQIECASGTYQPNTRQSSCLSCPDGYSCVDSKVTPSPCAPGHYCEGGNDNTCAAGTYNPAQYVTTSAKCAVCPPGKFCVTQGLASYSAPDCPAGFYCDLSAQKLAGDYTGQCAAGQYCPAGSPFPVACPGGKYCDGSDTLRDCFAGYYCKSSATKGNPGSDQEGGAICPAGYYCPLGSDSPTACPPGTYNPSTGSTSESACQNCPAGKYCQNAAAHTFTGSCKSGYLCPAAKRNVPHPVDNICPANHYCDGGASEIACQNNSEYQPNTGQSQCLTCPSGFICSTSGFTDCNLDHDSYCDSNYQVQSCGTGHYSPNLNAASSTECVAITAGFQFSITGGSPLEFSQTKCTAGKYCTQGSSTMLSCPAGSYCPQGSATPIKCKAGKYCAGTDNLVPDGDCTAGYYCIEGASSPTPTDGTTGNICPKGYYCPTGSNSPVACPIGTYRNAIEGKVVGDCAQCDAGRYCDGIGLQSPNILCFQGYYCDASSTSPNPREHSCTPGHKCPVGSTQETSCEAGEYQPSPLQGSCLPCPERYYCDTTGMRRAIICPAGKFCPQGTETPQNCAVGTYNPKQGLKSQNECKSCPLGYACEIAGMTEVTSSELCTAGSYCPLGSSSKTEVQCPAGYYCPAGTHDPFACPVGTYSDALGLTAETGCQDCPVGQYCPLTAASSAQVNSDTYKCTAGYYCSGKAITATPQSSAQGGNYCSVGKYCPRGATSQLNCPLGTYNPYQGRGECVSCPAGRLCDEQGMTSFKDCPAGGYCPEGSQAATDCPAGTYSPMTNLVSESECLECDPGKYCSGGASAVTGNCDAGYACFRGSSVKNPAGTFSFTQLTNGACPAGHYCPAGTKLPVQCPEGTYSSQTGLQADSACTACSPGFYCDKKGLIAPVKTCSAGFFCISGSTHPKPTDGTKGRPCSQGNYCPAGTIQEIPCSGGTYEPRNGSSECQQCPEGHYCPSQATAPLKCPFNKYCPAGSTVGINCPGGTYNSDQLGLEKSTQCTPCPTGKFCQQGQVSGDCQAGYFCHTGAAVSNPSDQRCPAGHYCLVGSTAPTVCPAGTVNENDGATSESDCTPCQLGYYCLESDPVPHQCPRGYYCDGENTGVDEVDPKPCPVDTYNPSLQQDNIADCLACPAGTYCNQKGIAYLDLYECDKGKYCENDPTPGTLVDPKNCPGGTYNEDRGAGLLSDCQECPAGSYCNVATGTIYPTKCRAGYFCPAGSENEQDCTAGNYCPYGSAAETPCPAGYYCPDANMYQINANYKCPPGTYCPQGSSSTTSCPVGYYGISNPDNHSQAEECVLCEQGYYQDQEGQTACKVCEPGYICLGGTTARFPTSNENGKQCAAGYYCPQESWEEVPCPVGTYQPQAGKSAASDCVSTAINYFTNKEAQTAPTSCGENAFNLATRQSTCSCKGKNRDFQPETSSCMCSIGFEPVGNDSLQNSKQDCQPLVYNLCPDNQIYNDRRECVSPNDCSSQCTVAVGGVVIDNVGLCECDIVSDPQLVCDATCRDAKDKFYVNSQGQIQKVSGGVTTVIETTTRPQLAGSLVCSGTCRMYSVGFSGNFFSGDYDMQGYIKDGASSLLLLEEMPQYNDRQLTSSQTEVLNPIICLKQSETLVFQVNSGAKEYPVYDTSSLLNTNNQFDYTAFTNLQTQIQSNSASISSFAFTFQVQGTYIFMNSLDNTKKMVVAVKTDSNACPSSDIYLMPITSQNLLSIGVEPKDNLFYQPNWVLIMGVLLAIIVLVVIFVLFILYYKRKQWRIEMPVSIPYRRLHVNTEFEEISANTKMLFKRHYQDQDDTEGLSSSHQSEKDREQEEKQRKLNQRYAIQQKKLDDMLNQADRIQTDFFSSDDRAQDMHRIVQLRVKDLLEKLRRIREGDDDSKEGSDRPGTALGRESSAKESDHQMQARKKDAEKAQKQEQRQVEKNSKQKQDFIEKMLADNDDRQERFKRMLDDKNLSPEERDALLKDFEMGERRINGLLEQEDRKQQDSLQRKLQERRERRNKMRNKVEELERKKDEKNKELRDAIQDLNDETAAKMQQVNDELQAEEDDVLGNVKQRMEKQRMNKRQEFQSLLGKNKKSDDMQQMINEYEEESHALERKLQNEFDSQKKNLRQTLEERRERKRLQLENERREKEKELVQMKNEEMAELEQELEKLKKVVENEKLNEKIENMVDQRLNKEDEQLEQLKGQNQKAQEELERKHQEELDRLEVESVTTADESVAHRDLIELDESKDQEGVELQKKQEELRKQIEGSDDPALRAQLMRQLEEHEDAMKMRIQKEQQSQKDSLEDKLAKRRMRKLQKKRELQEKQEQEKRYLQQKHLEDEQKIKMDNGDQELQQILRDIKLNVEVDARPFAIQKAMDQKHAKELSDLLMKQFKEKALELQGHMQGLMGMKTDELRINKELHQKKIERLDELKGAVDDQELTRRVEEVKSAEADKREDIEDKYLELQAQGENEITKRLLDKHTEELLKLKQKQNQEKQKIIENYIPEGLAREVFSDNIEDIQEDMERFKREIEEKREREMDAVAERERILKEQSELYRQQRNKLEAHEKFLTQDTAFAGARKKAKRFDMEQDAVTEQQKKLFDQYKQQDDEMKKIVTEEQNRQKEGFQEKLRQRREKREKMRQEREKELEELKQQQLAEEEKERELERINENSNFEKLVKQFKDMEKVYDKVKAEDMKLVEDKKPEEKKKEIKKLTRPTTQALTQNFLGINLEQQYSSESPLQTPKKPGGMSDDMMMTILKKIHTIEERLLEMKKK